MSMNVVQEWLADRCSLKQQTVLLSALRGCDGIPKEDVSKRLTRALRGTLLVSAHAGSPQKPSTFMSTHGLDFDRTIREFCDFLDHYPVHWVMHFAHACEIVGYKHPDTETRARWGGLYNLICAALHVTPETEFDCNSRLRDVLEGAVV